MNLTPSHPMQPLIIDEQDLPRFKKNKIVEYLYTKGNIDLGHIACEGFDVEDMEQFYQLMGYSVSRYTTLSFVSDRTLNAVDRAKNDPKISELQARLYATEAELKEIKRLLKAAALVAFNIHEDDLQ